MSDFFYYAASMALIAKVPWLALCILNEWWLAVAIGLFTYPLWFLTWLTTAPEGSNGRRTLHRLQDLWR